MYYTFVARRRARILGDPPGAWTSHDTRLAAKWTCMIRETSNSWSWFDQFLSCVTVRIGSDPALDRAANFALDSYATYRRNWKAEFVDAAQKSGIVAITALRNAINDKRSTGNHSIMVAAGVLYVAEVRILSNRYHVLSF